MNKEELEKTYRYFAWKLLELESLLMHGRSMLGQIKVKEFKNDITEVTKRINEIYNEINDDAKIEFFLAAEGIKDEDKE